MAWGACQVAGSNKAIFITLEGGFKKAICQAQVVKGRLDHRLSLIWHDLCSENNAVPSETSGPHIYLQKGPAVGALLGLWKIGVNKPEPKRSKPHKPTSLGKTKIADA